MTAPTWESEDGTVKILSLGWGVQSFTLAAMSALGDLPLLDYAVHADTGYEMTHTYAFAAKWTQWFEEHGVKVRTVQALAQRRDLFARKAMAIPAYCPAEGGYRDTQLKRECTDEWKRMPICRFIRAHAKAAEMWLGISLDEIERSRPSDVRYIQHVYPLLDRRMTRQDCIIWLERHGVDVPQKSSCYLCPYHRHLDWMRIKHTAHSDWQKALEIDGQIRHAVKGFTCFLHQSRKPLAKACDESQGVQLSLIGEECTGLCWT